MSSMFKFAESIKDRSVQEDDNEGWEAVLEDQMSSSLSSMSMKTVEEEHDCDEIEIDYMLRLGHWGALLEYVHSHPDTCFVKLDSKESKGNLALHDACKYGAPLYLVEALVQGNRKALQKKGCMGYLPVHYACANGCSEDVISFLVKECPDSVTVPEKADNMLPIHLACKAGVSEKGILALLAPFPESALIPDAFGRTPLNFAHTHLDGEVRTCLDECLGEKNDLFRTTYESATRAAEKRHKRVVEENEQVHQDELASIMELHNFETQQKEEQICAMETKISEHESSILELTAKTEAQASTIAEKSDELKTVSNKLSGANSRIGKHVEAIKELADNIKTMERVIAKKDMELKTRQETIDSQSERLVKAATYEQTIATMKEEYEQTIATMQEEHSAQATSLTERVNFLEKEVDTRNSTIRDLETEVSTNKTTIAKQAKELEDAAAHAVHAEEQHEKKVYELSVKIGTLSSALEHQNEKLNAQIDAEKKEVANLKAALAAKSGELEDAAAHLTKRESEFKEEIKSVKETHETEINKREAAFSAEKEQWNEERDGLNAQNQTLSLDVSDRDSAILNLMNQLKDKTQELSATKEVVDQKLALLKQSEDKCERLQTRLDGKNTELSSTLEEVDDLQGQVQQLASILTSIRRVATLDAQSLAPKSHSTNRLVATTAEVITAPIKTLEFETTRSPESDPVATEVEIRTVDAAGQVHEVTVDESRE
eukprot:Nitzschia sp. Nitz4//scaffold82_size85912//47961//50114//NITZ4_005144-RA/size85912-processed-gene-0.34-mRNA-1//-1//CDS//3329558844//1488//frame0